MVISDFEEHQSESKWYRDNANKWIHNGIFDCSINEFES